MARPMTAQSHDVAPPVRVVADAAAGAELALQELRAVVAPGRRPLISFATGATFRPLLARLQEEIDAGRIDPNAFVGTHLDEYLGFRPDQPGGMVHELGESCPALLRKLRDGSFLPVPSDGTDEALAAHVARLQRAGGVRLQFLGIGRNGHLAFNEPGTAVDVGFHTTTLAASTREDARPRFRPAEPPTRAATAGLGSILKAERLVLLAFGAGKAAAVTAMLRGPIGPDCPASAVRLHRNTLVVLDPAAAAGLGQHASA